MQNVSFPKLDRIEIGVHGSTELAATDCHSMIGGRKAVRDRARSSVSDNCQHCGHGQCVQ